VRTVERWVAGIGGVLLAAYGWRSGRLRGLAALLGGAMVTHAFGRGPNLARGFVIGRPHQPGAVVSRARGVKVMTSVTVSRSREELYRTWRKLEALPCWMTHLEAIAVLSHNRSHWIAKAPAGMSVEWDAEIFNERDNELIAWRSTERADVRNTGSVEFRDAPGWGTEVLVSLMYDPPIGAVGSAIAKIFGENPQEQVEEDLRRFKQVMETGEIATVQGQPVGS
jgi:uncharacterized membrane protein